MTITELEKIWSEFGYIPTNSDDKIEVEVEFYWWEKRTYRFNIWHWFDQIA